MAVPPKQDPIKICETCGEPFTRKRFNGRLEDRTRFQARRNCSQACGNTRTEVARGTHHWRARKHRQPTCHNCGTTDDLHVHHLDRNPANNDPSNLQTLCSSCHLKIHWAEDRPKRTAAAVKAAATAARRGAFTRKRSTDGKFVSAE